jgi:hypothetical protein
MQEHEIHLLPTSMLTSGIQYGGLVFQLVSLTNLAVEISLHLNDCIVVLGESDNHLLSLGPADNEVRSRKLRCLHFCSSNTGDTIRRT